MAANFGWGTLARGLTFIALTGFGCETIDVFSAPPVRGEPPSGADAGGVGEARFSFFVTSLVAMQSLSGSALGFGGDLRFGETGEGAGLRGADAICTAVARSSATSAGDRVWRAFLSTSQEDAIDRIGTGPWYDRAGRLIARNVGDLLQARPLGSDPGLGHDLPNEEGVPNRDPSGLGVVDNHDVLTGSDERGRRLRGGPESTCDDWTRSDGSGRPRVGHSWVRPTSGGSFRHWISAHDAPGCAPGVSLVQGGSAGARGTVGGGGGYGAIYCFAAGPAAHDD